jgi:predicted transcriptional regulator
MATKRRLDTQSIYLEPDKASMLDKLAAETRIPKAVLLREAVDDLLAKHGKLKAQRAKASK